MNIRIIAVGKVKEAYIRRLIDDTTKKIGGICPIEIVEVADERTPEGLSLKGKELVKAKEGRRILRAIRPRAFVIALAIEGNALTTEGLAKGLKNLDEGGTGYIDLIIGGSLGLDDEIKNRANLLLSFSRLTFPHQIMRLILLDQIYRAVQMK